jgi:hypothetical protein
MMPGDLQVTPEQLLFALLADLGVLALAVPVGLLGGSLTIKAEAIRFVLGMSIEIFAYTLAGSAGVISGSTASGPGAQAASSLSRLC